MGKIYSGRFAIVVLPYKASGYARAFIEDYRLNKEMGVLTLEASGSNYRVHRARVLLSSGAKTKMKDVVGETQAMYTTQKIYDFTLTYEKRDGRMDKMFLTKTVEQTNEYLAIIKYGSGYRGFYEKEKKVNIATLKGVRGDGALGWIDIDIIHVKPPAIFAIKRIGRLYGAPPWAVAVFTESDIVVDEMTDHELTTTIEELGLTQ